MKEWSVVLVDGKKRGKWDGSGKRNAWEEKREKKSDENTTNQMEMLIRL